jgi:hypothetical protein
MAEEPKSSESRRYPRLRESCRIRYKQVESGGIRAEGIDAITVNISGGGICFEATEALEVGSLLAVELSVPDFEAPVVSLGRVAWCEPSASGAFDVGMEFWWIGWGDEGAQKAISEHIRSALGE